MKRFSELKERRPIKLKRAALLATLGAIGTQVLAGGLGNALGSALKVPACTLPFCIAATLCFMLRGAIPDLVSPILNQEFEYVVEGEAEEVEDDDDEEAAATEGHTSVVPKVGEGVDQKAKSDPPSETTTGGTTNSMATV